MMNNTNSTKQDAICRPRLASIIPHCLIILVLDTSHSMWGKGLRDLKHSLQAFYKTIGMNGMINAVVDIAAVSMGDNLTMLEDFTPLRLSKLLSINIRPKGDTPIGAALRLAMRKIKEQVNQYQLEGVEYITPQLILLSDGKNSSDDFSAEANEIQKACAEGKLICRAIAMGNSPDCQALARIAGDNVTLPKDDNLPDAFTEAGNAISVTYEAEAEKTVPCLPPAEEAVSDAKSNVSSPRTEGPEYLLDGSNIIHWNKYSKNISLECVLALTRELEKAGKSFHVYFDATTRHVLKKECPDELQTYEHLLNDCPEHYHQVPAGTSADDFMLFLANQKPDSLIITNDQFKDHIDQYPWVKDRGRLLHGMVLDNLIFLPETAQQFPL